MPVLTSIIAVFCEDIREEKSGAFSLIGIFPDNAAVPLPNVPVPQGAIAITTLPKLHIYARMNFDPRAKFNSVSAKLIFPDGTESVVNAMDPATIAKAKEDAISRSFPIATVISRMLLAPFPIPVLGQLKLEIAVESATYLAGVLNFVQGDQPMEAIQTIVSSPPSSR